MIFESLFYKIMETIDFKTRELIEKILCLDTEDERLNMIWQWSITKVINRKQFKFLISNIKK